MQPDMALGNDKAEISPDGKTGDPVWKVSKFNSSVLRGLTNKWNGHIGLNCGLFAEGKENGTTANCRKRRSIDLRFLRYEGLTAVA